MRELTKKQIKRQDEVDNDIFRLLQNFSPIIVLPWDIEDIGIVRDAVQNVIVNKRHLMTEMEFYPYIPDATKKGGEK